MRTYGFLAWVTAVAVGMAGLTIYSSTPGVSVAPQALLGVGASATVREAPWTLVMGIHPRCPCTLASVSELERLLARLGDRVYCNAYAYTPAEDAGFARTQLVKNARAIPNVMVTIDEEGLLARQAGILTSGGVVLYDKHGQPRFFGGLTPSRGHEGDSQGKQAILAIVNGHTPQVASTPTYGCRITPTQ